MLNLTTFQREISRKLIKLFLLFLLHQHLDEQTVCGRDTLNIQCDNEETIDIDSVFYGRDDQITCITWLPLQPSQVRNCVLFLL